MNFKTTVVLLLLLAMVGGYFWIVERGRETEPLDSPETLAEGGAPLFSAEQFPTERIASVTVQRGSEQAVLTRKGSEWEQTQPVTFALNSWSVRDVIDKAAKLRYVEKFTPGQGDAPTLSDVALDKPAVVLTLKGEGDQAVTQTLKLGRKTVGGRGYLMVNEDPVVYVVQHDVHEQVLDKPTWDWRKKSLSMPTEGQSQQVWLTRDGQTVELIKHETQWALGSPLSGRASTKAVSDLLTAAGGVWVTKFVADLPKDLGIYGLDKPAKVIKAQQTAPPPAEGKEPAPASSTALLIGSPTDLKQDQFFAALVRDNEPVKVVFTITRSDAEKFDKSVDDLRDKRVTVVKAADVTNVKMERVGQSTVPTKEFSGPLPPIHMDRSASGWTFGAPAPTFAIDHELASQFVETLAGLEAESFVANLSPGTAQATVTLAATGRPEPEVLRFFAHDGGKQFAIVRNNESIAQVVDAAKVQQVFADPVAFRDRQVLALKAEDLAGLSITQSDGTKIEMTQGEKGWAMAGGGAVEMPAVNLLLSRLLPLRAQTWLNPWAVVSFENQPQIKAVLTPRDGQPVSLSIDPKSRQARLVGEMGLFEVSQNLVDALDAELRPRTVVSASTDQIKQVSVTRGGKTTLVKRSGMDYVDGEDKPLDATAAAGLLDALGGLKAVRFIAAPAGAGEPVVSLDVQADGAESRKIDVYADKLARSGERWFTLEENDYKRLTADLAKK